MSTKTSSLIIRLIDQVTGPANKVAASVKGLNSAIARNNARLDAMRGRMADAVGAGFLLAKALGSPLKAAMEFESAMADVRKVVDFDTPEAFKAFQQDVLEMSTKIPMAGKALSDIVAAAGQAGLAFDELLPFTEMAAKVGVAFDISAGQAGDALAKLKTGLGLTIPQTAKMADAMNHLSNAMASSATDILDVVRRVGANAKQYGFNEIQVSAFASAMLSAGAQSEVAATSFQNMGRALTRGASATKRQREAFAALRLDAGKVAKAMQKDAVGTTLDVFKRLSELPAHVRASVASDLFGDEARALGPLLTNLPLLRQALGLVADETEYAGSANKEYAARAKTFANAVQLMKNRMERLAITVGTILIPPISELMERLAPIVDRVKDFAEAHPKLTRNLIAAASSLVAFRVAAIAASWAGLFMMGGLLRAGQTAAKAATGIGLFARALIIAPAVRAVTAALAGLRAALIATTIVAGLAGKGTGLAMMGRALLGLLNPIKLVSVAMVGLKWALRGVLVGSGVGAVLVGLGVAAEWVRKNWENLTIAFEAFKGAFLRGIAPLRDDPGLAWIAKGAEDALSAISNLTSKGDVTSFVRAGIAAGKGLAQAFVTVASAVQRVSDAIGWVSEKWNAFNQWDQGLTNRMVDGAKSAWADFSSWWDSAVTNLSENGLSGVAGSLYDAGASAIQSLWDGMVSKFEAMLTWLASLPSRIASAVGNIDLSGIIQWPSLPKWAKRIWGSDEEEAQALETPSSKAPTPAPDRPIAFRPAKAEPAPPPSIPAVAPQVDVTTLDNVVSEAQVAGQKVEAALSVSAAPSVDASQIANALDLARRLNAELARSGPLAQQVGRSVGASFKNRQDGSLHDGAQ